MFDPTDRTRVFGLPPGADFPRLLVEALTRHHAGRDPRDLARVRVIVNTSRMARRVRDLFDAGPAVLLPRIDTIDGLAQGHALASIPPAAGKLQRRLDLAQLVARLLEAEPDLAPRAALYDLSESLAGVLAEMDSEGVPARALRDIDVSDMSAHWTRALRFLMIAQSFEAASGAAPSAEARLHRVIEAVSDSWRADPPQTPVILAGSTGSRGPSQRLMGAVARLPQGAVLLPGFDFDMPASVWDTLGDPMTGEDHPQFRFARLLRMLDLTPAGIRRWSADAPPAPARNRVVSLALRPAPVTDQWRDEGAGLTDLDAAMRDVTLVEAPSSRIEALTIAMRLRAAVEEGGVAALITPDRMLTRQVTAALDRWRILPDDSAGLPLHLSAPGRFLRHVAGLLAHRLTAEDLLALLKHPLTHSGDGRGNHLLLTRELDLALRREGPPFPDAAFLRAFAAGRREPGAEAWADWIVGCLLDQRLEVAQPLTAIVDLHQDVATRIARGAVATEDAGDLWDRPAGREAEAAMASLMRAAPHGGVIAASDYAALLDRVLADHEVRDRDAPDPRVLIWGTLEARVQGADLVILGGLNEGSWPEMPAPDPWLNRRMRAESGLLLPERRIGLAAHDFQQAIAAPQVWLTRAIRSQDAETVPSRWISRLTSLLGGLPGEGPVALADMRARGADWMARAQTLEAVERVAPAPRPAPRPPLAARPDALSVTEIRRLIRDPYAIYARRILRLERLDPLMKAPDALLRGTVIHDVMERFIRATLTDPGRLNRDTFLADCDARLADLVPWPQARLLWSARLARIADSFLADETARRVRAQPAAFEVSGVARIADPPFRLKAKADRIDLDPAGNAWIYDYKTGAPPTPGQQEHFDRQLLLSAAIAEREGFDPVTPRHVAGAVYIGLGRNAKEVPAPLDKVPAARAWAEFETLIRAYSTLDQGYTARRAMFQNAEAGDYDQLARFGEWDLTVAPDRGVVG